VLYDHRDQVMPLVTGLRQYVQTLAISIRIDVGDGTLMAAVEGLLGGDLCGTVISCPTDLPVANGLPLPAPELPSDLPLDLPLDVPLGPLGSGSTSTSTDSGLFDFLDRVLAG
jgi:hypothetical protein